MIETLDMPCLAAVLAEGGSLFSLYVIALIVGGGLIFISTVFGSDGDSADVGLDGDISGDMDMDFDADVDVDGFDADVDVAVESGALESGTLESGGLESGHGHDVSDLTLAQWFSVRFLVYFLAMFGLVGTTLSWLTVMSFWAVLGLAVLGGVVSGQMVHQIMRLVQRTGGNSQLSTRDFVNQVGRVTAAVGGDQPGEVAVSIRGSERYVSARTRHAEDRFSPGDAVGVIAFRGGVAEIVSKKEFEFLVDEAGRKKQP